VTTPTIGKWLKKNFLTLIENTKCEHPAKKQTHYQILNLLNELP